MGEIFSPGKLMLTSEYFAVDGALVLAVPTKLGQEFFFDEIEDAQSIIIWEAYHQNKLWLTARIDYKKWEILDTNLKSSAEFILKVLKNVQILSELKFQSDTTYHLKTNLQFPSDYGLGSSSTLMTNLAEWAEIDPFYLNTISLGGSGYDIAVAKAKSAVLFQNKPTIQFQPILFQPKFAKELIFIHLNQKQDSREGISLYKSKVRSQNMIDEFSNLTRKVLKCDDLEIFSQLMTIHEQKIADFIEIPTVKSIYFNDCPVFVKSLGAWGGDFIMSCKFVGYKDYFWGKGFATIFDWSDLID